MWGGGKSVTTKKKIEQVAVRQGGKGGGVVQSLRAPVFFSRYMHRITHHA